MPLSALEGEHSTWLLSKGVLQEVASSYTKARSREGLMAFDFPAESEWKKMGDAQKMLYIINSERQVRGLKPLKAVSKSVSRISQEYAVELLHHNKFSHRLNGNNSWMRLQSNPEIAQCMNRIEFAENLAWFGSQRGYQKFFIERAVFSWMYDDGEHGWRHRAMLLYDNFSQSSSSDYVNALIGVGIAYGKTLTHRYAIYIVLNYVDPCRSWHLD